MKVLLHIQKPPLSMWCFPFLFLKPRPLRLGCGLTCFAIHFQFFFFGVRVEYSSFFEGRGDGGPEYCPQIWQKESESKMMG